MTAQSSPPSRSNTPVCAPRRLWRRVVVASAFLGCSVLASPLMSHAADVFINGVKVSGLTSETFDKAQVRFDEKGDVHITVPDVKIRFEGSPTEGSSKGAVTGRAEAEKPRLSRDYFLISSQTSPGATQYDIEIHINGRFVTRARSADGKQLTIKLNEYLSPGDNTVVFTAVKRLGEGRKSFSRQDEFTLLLGQGEASGQQIIIEKTLVRYSRDASQVDNDTYSLNIRVE